MSRSAQDTLLLVFGCIMLRVGVTDLHLRFVKAQMQPLIVLAAVVLIVIGAIGLYGQLRAPAAGGSARGAGRQTADGAPEHAGHEHDGPGHAGHGHDGSGHGPPRAAWLLALPLFVLLLIAPPPLGADAVNRSSPVTLAPADVVPALPAAVDGAVDLAISDYSQRAFFAPETVVGETVRLVGFAVPDDEGWLLARLTLSCCAADGRPVTARMTGPGSQPVPAADEWFEAVGRYVPSAASTGDEQSAPSLEVTSLQRIEPPSSPYESR